MTVEIVSWALSDLTLAKEFLGITVADYDDLISRLINQASSFIEKTTDRKLVARSYDSTDDDDREDTWFDGMGTKNIFLRQYPINSVSSVTCSGTTISAASSTDYYGSTGYVIYKRRGILFYDNGWDSGVKNVRVSYNAGYASGTPELEDLRELCNSLISHTYNNRKNLGFKMERIGNYQYTRGDVREQWQSDIISRYRRKMVA